MVLRARKLRYKATIQQPIETIDSVGQSTQTWTTYAIRWVQPVSPGGREVFKFQQFVSEADMVFKVRFDNLTRDITTKMRVSYNSRTFDIKSFHNVDEMNREIMIICTEQI